MKLFIKILFSVSIAGMLFVGCKKDNDSYSPAVSYQIEGVSASTEYHNGDLLSGRVVILEESLIPGTEIKKIDCRLGNIVIGSVENSMVCPFGVVLHDKPAGIHILSVIIKCESPDCDETYWRYDLKMINIKD